MSERSEIEKVFGNKVRVRACGICTLDNQLLLIKHKNLGKDGYLWAPPGGGVSFGENIEDCLKREFKEETGLEIEVGQFLFIYEFVQPPLHAIELFFSASLKSGKIERGMDPELPGIQIIDEVKFCSFEFIKNLDQNSLHKMLHQIQSVNDLHSLSGFYR